jgi:hypothetical protein
LQEKFVTQLEHNLYKPKPNTYKILKHLNQETRETGDIQCPLHKELCLQYYKKLWTDSNYRQEHQRPHIYDEEIITLHELEKVIKNLKNGKARGEDNINSELYKYTPKNFLIRLLIFYNNVYILGEIPKEWNNATVIPYRSISLLNTCYKIYAKILNEKLKTHSKKFLMEP